MMQKRVEHLGNGVINIHIPFAVKRRGGRKLILSPDGDNPVFAAKPRQDNSLLKVLVRAYKWREHYDEGKYKSLDALAEKLDVNKSYLARVMRVNLLAPDIKESILNGTQPRTMTVTDVLKPFPESWQEQRGWFGFTTPQL
jgi:hypothetical protein